MFSYCVIIEVKYLHLSSKGGDGDWLASNNLTSASPEIIIRPKKIFIRNLFFFLLIFFNRIL